MSRRRVVVDFEFQVDDDEFKAATLSAEGVADLDDTVLRDVVSRIVIDADWRAHGVQPLRTIVTPRILDRSGWYKALHLVRDRGVEPAA